MIEEDLLHEFGCREFSLNKDEFIFRENEQARFYFQIKSGEVAVLNFTEKGDEFVQGIFQAGQSFGEPPLFGNFQYPADAKTNTESVILALNKNAFQELLKSNFDIHFRFTSMLSKRMMYKSIMMKEIARENPEHRILSVMKLFKGTDTQNAVKINLTRQQVANLTGLRVETVIRSMKKLEENGAITIVKGKVYL